MALVSNLGILPAMNGIVPCEGAKCIPFTADFSAAAEYDFNFTPLQQQGQISTIQCVYVDNTGNGSNLVLTVGGTQQTITVPKNSAGFFTIIAPQYTTVKATTAGMVAVYLAFLNFYIPPIVWAAP
jgi:hypothetical protein